MSFTQYCERCVPLGSFVNEDGEDVDLYAHVNPEDGENVAQSYVVRYGDEAEEYLSVPSFIFVNDASIIEAEARAARMGIRSRVLERED